MKGEAMAFFSELVQACVNHRFFQMKEENRDGGSELRTYTLLSEPPSLSEAVRAKQQANATELKHGHENLLLYERRWKERQASPHGQISITTRTCLFKRKQEGGGSRLRTIAFLSEPPPP